ncbi:MarR family transcriptional regulator [Amycolatopsis acidicola]|uniref:MarR family transcriptional regulator n=1 Tax=Amycolatopsis acidicola TaxID=2596893 RepID=A0A5N0V2L5_9PSEU|nr:MarR family transcriptional regulator [Amycolatopsis acidicola]KAA9158718.1 MarR family transcriptional regulator [Amycolatopsis acidicola]
MTEDTGAEPDPAVGLLRLLPALRRALIRATRAVEALPSLPEAQVAVLRTLVETGPLTPAQLAGELHLARPTVSNLVREMAAAGLVERRPSPVDKRSVLLEPTARGRYVRETFTRGRAEVLARAFAEIPATDRKRLTGALSALQRLLARVEAAADAVDDAERKHA